MITQNISKEAGSLLNTINKGTIPLNQIKGFLARVENLASPAKTRRSKVSKYADIK